MIALFGVVALGELAVNTIFGRFAPLLGLVLITPNVIHELNEEISDVVLTKKIAYWHVLGLRLIFSLVLVTAILIGYVAILIMNDSVVSFTQLRDGWINTVFLGSVGLLGVSLFKNVTTGYMVAILYYFANFFIPKELGMFYLFNMSVNKIPLLLCAIVYFGFALYWNGKQK